MNPSYSRWSTRNPKYQRNLLPVGHFAGLLLNVFSFCWRVPKSEMKPITRFFKRERTRRVEDAEAVARRCQRLVSTNIFFGNRDLVWLPLLPPWHEPLPKSARDWSWMQEHERCTAAVASIEFPHPLWTLHPPSSRTVSLFQKPPSLLRVPHRHVKWDRPQGPRPFGEAIDQKPPDMVTFHSASKASAEWDLLPLVCASPVQVTCWKNDIKNQRKEWRRIWCSICQVGSEIWTIYPLVMTNIAMENGPFIEDFPIKPPFIFGIFHGKLLVITRWSSTNTVFLPQGCPGRSIDFNFFSDAMKPRIIHKIVVGVCWITEFTRPFSERT